MDLTDEELKFIENALCDCSIYGGACDECGACVAIDHCLQMVIKVKITAEIERRKGNYVS